jgi:hypothetical protein
MDEAKHALAQRKVIAYRRETKPGIHHAHAPSFILPAPQPAADEAAKDNAEPEKAEGAVAKFVEKIKASSRALEIVKPFENLSPEQVQTYLDAMNPAMQ